MKNSLATPEIETRLNDRVFRALMANANDAIFVLDDEGVILHGNRQAEKLLGFSEEELIGKAYHEFVVPDDLEFAASEIGQIIEGNPSAHSEVSLKRRDGKVVRVDFSAVMVELEHGRVMMSIGRDVTEQRRAEEERTRLASIVESSNDAIYAMDLQGVINVWNPGAEKLFGFCQAEMLGHYFFKLVPADRHKEILKMLEDCKRGLTISHFETARKDRQQAKIPVSVSWFPIRDKKEKVIGVSAIVRDLTEQKNEFFMSREERVNETCPEKF